MPDLREAIKLGLAKCRVHDDDIDWMANIIARRLADYVVIPRPKFEILLNTAEWAQHLYLEMLEKALKEVPSDAKRTQP